MSNFWKDRIDDLLFKHITKGAPMRVDKAKVICIKEGRMEEGQIFAYKGEKYWALINPEETPGEGEHYEIRDELWDEHYKIYHGMDKEFFNEYFEVLNGDI